MTAIRALLADRVRIPFRRPFPTATGMWLEREAWIIRIVDGDGRIGLGEAVVEPDGGEVAETILAHLVHDAAAGARDGRLPDGRDLELHGAPGRALRAAVDSALLDLGTAARPAGARLAAGPDTGVGVNATLPALGPAATAEAARQAVAVGFRTLKLKAGWERETEGLIDRVRAVRESAGPDVRLRIDVNGAWDVGTATDRLRAIARYDIEYVEQPVPAVDVAGLADLRRHVPVPIAADESASSARAVRELLAIDAVDVLVIKPGRVGGPAAVWEIAEQAADRGVPVVISTLFESGVGVAAATLAAADLPPIDPAHGPVPADHGLATAGLLVHDLLVDPLIVRDGRIRAPGTRGGGRLGVVLDEAVLGRFRQETVA